jgi:hypothetical protein
VYVSALLLFITFCKLALNECFDGVNGAMMAGVGSTSCVDSMMSMVAGVGSTSCVDSMMSMVAGVGSTSCVDSMMSMVAGVGSTSCVDSMMSMVAGVGDIIRVIVIDDFDFFFVFFHLLYYLSISLFIE